MDFQNLQKHPRFVELMISKIYHSIYKLNYNHIQTAEFLIYFAEFNKLEGIEHLKQVFANMYKVLSKLGASGQELIKFRQQMIITSLVFEDTVKDAADILRVTAGTLYREPYKVEEFANDRFIDQAYIDTETIFDEETLNACVEFILHWQYFKEAI